MTWPLWQVRSQPPNLPVWERLPDWPFGELMLASLALAAIAPRIGSPLHAIVLALACSFDQSRTQPQVLCIVVLLLTSVFGNATWFGRYFLAALWMWAGTHKLLSPDWHGEQSWLLAAQLRLEPAATYRFVAVLIPLYEIVLGVLGVTAPRKAIWLSVPLHLGICIVLSPLLANWNATVIPWNIAIASTGSWLLWQARGRWPASPRQTAIAVVLFTFPAGYYIGWVDHSCAFILYSDNLPRGLITNREGSREIETWSELNASFNQERRLLRQYFALSAQAGWKLHVADPRRWLGDEYWMRSTSGQLQRLSIDEFFDQQQGSIEGVACDDRRAVFRLAIAGARLLKRQPQAMIYAAEIKPEAYSEELLKLLSGLPNLEQIQLRDCPVTDAHLRNLPRLRKLIGIGLEGTDISDAAIDTLRDQPRLRFVEADRTRITSAALAGTGWSSGASPTTTD